MSDLSSDDIQVQVDMGCGFWCKLKKAWHSVFNPDKKVNPNGTLSENESRATGWKNNDKMRKNASKTRRKNIPTALTMEPTSLPSPSINAETLNIPPPCNCPETNNNSITINGRNINFVNTANLDFDFTTMGAVFSNNSTADPVLYQLNATQRANLNAIAQFLIYNDGASVRFQYPTLPSSIDPNLRADTRAVYRMSFTQITRYLRAQGVQQLNRSVLRSTGQNSAVFLNANP